MKKSKNLLIRKRSLKLKREGNEFNSDLTKEKLIQVLETNSFSYSWFVNIIRFRRFFNFPFRIIFLPLTLSHFLEKVNKSSLESWKLEKAQKTKTLKNLKRSKTLLLFCKFGRRWRTWKIWILTKKIEKPVKKWITAEFWRDLQK